MNKKIVSTLLTWVVFGCRLATMALAASAPYECDQFSVPPSTIDGLVFQDLERRGIQRAHPCSDAVFIRRVYLDLIGTIPTGHEVQSFLRDQSANKRRLLIDRLLERDEFADYWSMRWGDVLRVKAEFPINLWPNAVQAYHRWIRSSVRDNKALDQFARELLTSSGSNFREGPVNFYRAMQDRQPAAVAQTVALTFMAQRAEKWPREKLDGMAGLFSAIGYKATGEWKEEIVFFDPNLLTNRVKAGLPDGSVVRLSAGKDPREVFADWLLDPNNPVFANAMANRIWSWFMGRGIVHEPDDMRSDNGPVNPELLSYLASEMREFKYDFKKFCRLIVESRTYQLSAVPRGTDTNAELHFAHYALRRLEAEVLADAINQITGSTEKYSSPIPEPFAYIPETQRSIALGDASISSTFLEMFGRSSRDTGLEAERNNRPTSAQRLHLLNSSHIQRKIEQSRMVQYQTESKGTLREMAVGMYLGILSRYPTDQELNTLQAYGGADKISKREAAVDLAWALVNSSEFLYRH